MHVALSCSHEGALHADHILPRSAFYEGVRDLYDIAKIPLRFVLHTT